MNKETETFIGACSKYIDKQGWTTEIPISQIEEKGYRKINENEVVISKEEYEKIWRNGWNEGYSEILVDTIKKTAEKFYDLVKEKIEQIEKFYFDNGEIGYNGLTVKELNKLAKQFGVDLGE